MLFTSMEFLLFFLPLVFGVYYLLPRAAKNYFLLLASLLFYAWGEPVFVLIMLASIAINYLLALWIERLPRPGGKRKAVMALDLVLNLGILFVYKYLNFITATLHSLIPTTRSLFPRTAIALPIGISFFTFQALSYVIDVYRGRVRAQGNPAYIGLYISLFPQLIAGPIVRYSTVMDEITTRRVTVDDFSRGAVRFMVGFNKKMLLANVMAEVADVAFGANAPSACMAWFGALCYSLQIYFDFSGYSDMAIGLGRMLGFHFLENFDYPYISRTITEFWRRWHISLGTWFRDYVYFPLGGSRVRSRLRLVANLMVVWLLTGIWHGANWTFILWGVLYGVWITVEKLTGIPKKYPGWPAALRAAYRLLTLLLILLGWVLFRADSLAGAWMYLRAMLGAAGNPLVSGDFIFYGREYAVPFAAALLCCVPVPALLRQRLSGRERLAGGLDCAGSAAQLALFAISFSMLVMNAHNPFIYFNF